MTTSQIIIVIAAILGSGITGYWIGKWWSESCSVPIIAQYQNTLARLDQEVLVLNNEKKMSIKLIISLNSLVNQHEQCKKTDDALIEAQQKMLGNYIELYDNIPDYSSIPADILPDKDIRINTGNNQP